MGEEKVNYSRNMRKYLQMLKRYRWQAALLVFFTLIISATWTGEKLLLKKIVDLSAEPSITPAVIDSLSIIGLIFLGFLLIRPACRWLCEHLANKIDIGLVYDIKALSFNHLIDLSHKFHTSNKTGSMISKLIRGSSAIEKLTDIIVYNTLPLLFEASTVVITLAVLDPRSAIIMIGTGIVFAIFAIVRQNIQNKAHIAANNAEDHEKGKISDIFTNVDSVKNFGKDTYIKNLFDQTIHNTKKLRLKDWNYNRFTFAGQAFIMGLGTMLLVYFSVQKYIAGELSLGTIVFIYTSFGAIMSMLWGFISSIKEYYKTMADIQPIFEYLEIEPEIKDKPEALELNINKGSVHFDNVSFKYGQRKIFEEFNLKIPEGKSVALVGHSGSGKSTLIKLLYRLYDVDRGSIKIDGIDIRDVKQESLRSEMSIVPQDCILFDDTIYNNILFGNPLASREEVLAAIKFAQLDTIINEFPSKEDTIVGERGVKLSGGEKQRVNIARAVLANKKVLVLDEATSSLDSKTEHDIQLALKKLVKNRTTIIIAHRLSTIMSADIIVVLHKGKIVQMGKHNNLIKQEGEYKKLWNLQKGGYIK